RIGTMCTSTGCFVDAKARTVCRTPRVNLLKLLAFGIPVKLRLVNPLLYGLDFVISNDSVPYGGTITSIVGEWTGPVRAFRAARGYFLFNHRSHEKKARHRGIADHRTRSLSFSVLTGCAAVCSCVLCVPWLKKSEPRNTRKP